MTIYHLKNRLKRLPYLSIWIVLFVDIFTCAISFTIAYIVFCHLQNTPIELLFFLEKMLISLIVYSFFFFVFKTYSGIVRHSTLIDSIRILKAIICANLVLISLNFILNIFIGKNIYLNIDFLITASLTFVLMYCMRLFTKLIYDYLLKNKKKITTPKEAVLIWGINRTALSIAEMIEANKPQFHLIGFVYFDKKLQGKMLMNTSIFSSIEYLSHAVKLFNIKTVFVSEQEIEYDDKNDFIDYCQTNDIKVVYISSLAKLDIRESLSRQMNKINIEDLLGRPSILIDDSLVKMQLNNRTVLITGAAGSIGSEIVRQVLQTEAKLVILCDCAETPLNNIYLELSNKYSLLKMEMCIANIRDRERINRIFSDYRPDYVFHAAAYKHVPIMESAPSEAILTNVMGTKNLVDCAILYGVKKFVMISTDKAVNPTNVMGASKRIAEIYAQSISEKEDMKTKFVTTRFGNVLGSNGSVIPLFKKQIEKGGPVTVTHPDIIRYFMTIPEACRLVLEAGVMGKASEIFIFDMGEPVRIVDLAERMIRLAGYVPYKDIKIEFVGLRLGEKLYEELLNDKELTTKTHHKKIMIAKVRTYPFEEINSKIELLIKYANTYDNIQVVKLMKDIVPEFISKNSIYEKLDNSKELKPIM